MKVGNSSGMKQEFEWTNVINDKEFFLRKTPDKLARLRTKNGNGR